MPAESSIYWESVDSQRSTSGGSSGDVCSTSGSGARHYVDPWDLENYAYLRRHSVATPVPAQRTRRRRASHDGRAENEHWSVPASREPGYDAPAFVEELYAGGVPRQINNACYYHQPIYEDEVPDYVSSFPVYAPLSDLEHNEIIEDRREPKHRHRSSSVRGRQRDDYFRIGYPTNGIIEESNVPYQQEPYPSKIIEAQGEMYAHTIPPTHLDLNTYGHLKIDYTDSWNSLNRKINK